MLPFLVLAACKAPVEGGERPDDAVTTGHPSAQVDIACQDIEGLTFAALEPWQIASPDYLAYAVWLGDSLYRGEVSGRPDERVGALTVFDGWLYAGIGDWHFNAGSRFCPEAGGACPNEDAPGHGIPLLAFQPGTDQPTFAHVLPEEQLGVFRRTGDALLVAGMDPSDGDGAPECCSVEPTSPAYCADEAAFPHDTFELGTFYRQTREEWVATQSLPGGIHVFDVAVQEGILYASGSAVPDPQGESYATIWRSDDDGLTWDYAHVMEEGVDHPRITTLVPLGDQVVGFGYHEDTLRYPLRIVGGADGFQSAPDLLPELEGFALSEVFDRDSAFVWGTSAGDTNEAPVAVTIADGAVTTRTLEGFDGRRIVGAYLLCEGDLLVLSVSGQSYAVHRTRDLVGFETTFEGTSELEIASFAFWEGDLLFGADDGWILRAEGILP